MKTKGKTTARPLLYVCAPYATATPDEVAERDRAIKSALEKGWCPIFGPYLLERFVDDNVPEEREAAIECDLAILAWCDALLVIGDRTTAGMQRELAAWERRVEDGQDAPSFTWPKLEDARASL